MYENLTSTIRAHQHEMKYADPYEHNLLTNIDILTEIKEAIETASKEGALAVTQYYLDNATQKLENYRLWKNGQI